MNSIILSVLYITYVDRHIGYIYIAYLLLSTWYNLELESGNLNWWIAKIRLAYGHVCERLFWLIIDMGGPQGIPRQTGLDGIKILAELGMVVLAFNPRTWKIEADKSLSLRPAYTVNSMLARAT